MSGPHPPPKIGTTEAGASSISVAEGTGLSDAAGAGASTGSFAAGVRSGVTADSSASATKVSTFAISRARATVSARECIAHASSTLNLGRVVYSDRHYFFGPIFDVSDFLGSGHVYSVRIDRPFNLPVRHRYRFRRRYRAVARVGHSNVERGFVIQAATSLGVAPDAGGARGTRIELTSVE